MTGERIRPIDLEEAFATFDESWNPRVVAELNGQHVKIARLDGEFVWHRHQHEDELFLVLSGRLRLEFRDHSVELGPGQLAVVPRGIDHRPVADPATRILLFEPASTLNTGNVRGDRTVDAPVRLDRSVGSSAP